VEKNKSLKQAFEKKFFRDKIIFFTKSSLICVSEDFFLRKTLI